MKYDRRAVVVDQITPARYHADPAAARLADELLAKHGIDKHRVFTLQRLASGAWRVGMYRHRRNGKINVGSGKTPVIRWVVIKP